MPTIASGSVSGDALLEAAAAGTLPEWASASRRRRAHMERVADLMGEWADALDLPRQERVRWRAAGYLHDALRDAPPDELRPFVPDSLRTLAPGLLHGPAAAQRLREDGVTDEPLLHAIAYHTIGHRDLDTLGRALYIADFVEPGRRHQPARLAALRARMPHEMDDVLREVLRARMERHIAEGRMIRTETAQFWNSLGHGVEQ